MKSLRWTVPGFFLTVLLTGSFCRGTANPLPGWPALLSSSTCVPAEEAWTHIGGGFFSVFESRVGQVNESEGTVVMRLRKLYHSSRFCYRPDGELILRSFTEEDRSFSMERLDYIREDERGPLFYRLRLFPAGGCDSGVLMACLICAATVEASPRLNGTLYILRSDGPAEILDIRITGRNQTRSDNHLNKVIFPATVL